MHFARCTVIWNLGPLGEGLPVKRQSFEVRFEENLPNANIVNGSVKSRDNFEPIARLHVTELYNYNVPMLSCNWFISMQRIWMQRVHLYPTYNLSS